MPAASTCSLTSRPPTARPTQLLGNPDLARFQGQPPPLCACPQLAPAALQVTCQQPGPTAAQVPGSGGLLSRASTTLRTLTANTCRFASRPLTAIPTDAQVSGYRSAQRRHHTPPLCLCRRLWPLPSQPRSPQLLPCLDPAPAPCWFAHWSSFTEGKARLEKATDYSKMVGGGFNK